MRVSLGWCFVTLALKGTKNVARSVMKRGFPMEMEGLLHALDRDDPVIVSVPLKTTMAP
jgi:hypothetical protein